VIEPSVLRELASVLANTDSFLVLDAVFQPPDASLWPHPLPSNLITIGSFSKLYGLPGLRFGWLTAPSQFAQRLRTLHQYLTLSTNSVAAVTAQHVFRYLKHLARSALLAENRAILLEWARRHAHLVHLTSPSAGTTAIVTPLVGASEHHIFTTACDAGVFVIPGQRCFGTGSQPWLRISYGANTEVFARGLQTLATALQRLYDFEETHKDV
jgi:DNA-binding transcriptional MocR family regulator